MRQVELLVGSKTFFRWKKCSLSSSPPLYSLVKVCITLLLLWINQEPNTSLSTTLSSDSRLALSPRVVILILTHTMGWRESHDMSWLLLMFSHQINVYISAQTLPSGCFFFKGVSNSRKRKENKRLVVVN